MLLSLILGADPRELIIHLLLSIPIVLIALSTHEAAHGYIAYKMGDRTAFNLGRVTLNPAKHLDLVGTILMILFGYGWAKPVPINPRNFKNPKKGMALTALAGPCINLILGIIGTFAYSLTLNLALRFPPEGQFALNVINILIQFFFWWAIYNYLYAVFNLIPVPPFDGSRFATLFLPTKWYFGIMKYERYILIGILVGNIVLSRAFGINVFSWLAEKLFSLTVMPFHALFDLILF